MKNLNRKVFVNSQGGIGNQLFQAAAAHDFALSNPRCKIYFVKGNDPSERSFELKGFFNDCNHVITSKLLDQIFWIFNRFYDKLNNRFVSFKILLQVLFRCEVPRLEINNQSSEIINLVIRESNSAYLVLRGYFQSITFTGTDKECFNRLLKNQILMQSSCKQGAKDFILMHARRGDYFINPSLGPLSIEYFKTALDVVSTECQGLSLLIHSDGDESEFSSIIDRFHFLRSRSFSKNAWDCLFDSTNARYFVGSNSTLSWWASYSMQLFSPSVGRVSIFPSEWYVRSPVFDLELFNTDWRLVKADWV